MSYKNFSFKKSKSKTSAIALKYDDNLDTISDIVIRRKGKMAEELIQRAKERNIPIQENKSLIGNLLDIDLGEDVPPQIYSVIAEIFILLKELEENS